MRAWAILLLTLLVVPMHAAADPEGRVIERRYVARMHPAVGDCAGRAAGQDDLAAPVHAPVVCTAIGPGETTVRIVAVDAGGLPPSISVNLENGAKAFAPAAGSSYGPCARETFIVFPPEATHLRVRVDDSGVRSGCPDGEARLATTGVLTLTFDS